MLLWLLARRPLPARSASQYAFDWLIAEASKAACRQLRLLSGVKRTDAHRFYLRKGMIIEAHYFSLNLPPQG